MDLDGAVLTPGGAYNAAGFTIHSGVYKACPDANCVLHTHTRAGAGVSLLRRGLRPISQESLHVIDDVVYHEYGVPASAEECEALGEAAPPEVASCCQPWAADPGRDHPRRADAAVYAGAGV